MVLGFIAWAIIMSQNDASADTESFKGGMNLFSAAFALWEATMAIAINIGLIGFFKEKLNRQHKLGKWMADNAFAVYMFHLQIIIAVALLMRPVDLPPIAKWLVLSVICLPLCYGAAHFIFRKIPLLKKIL
jgi:surface polysaccharide O-acyltransferase-like enzyme